MFKTSIIRQIILSIVSIILVIGFLSCNKNEDMIDGPWDPIKLSRYEVIIPPEGGETTVVVLHKSIPWFNDTLFWDNALSEDGQLISSSNGTRVDHDWFSIWYKIEDGYEVIYVKLAPNDTGCYRKLCVWIQDGSMYERFYVYQNSLTTIEHNGAISLD